MAQKNFLEMGPPRKIPMSADLKKMAAKTISYIVNSLCDNDVYCDKQGNVRKQMCISVLDNQNIN